MVEGELWLYETQSIKLIWIEEHGLCESFWMNGNLTWLDSSTDCQCAQKLSQVSFGCTFLFGSTVVMINLIMFVHLSQVGSTSSSCLQVKINILITILNRKGMYILPQFFFFLPTPTFFIFFLPYFCNIWRSFSKLFFSLEGSLFLKTGKEK